MKKYIPALFLFLLSCSTQDNLEYKDGKQRLKMDQVNSKGESISKFESLLIRPDSIFVGQEATVKIVSKSENQAFVNAFYKCKFSDKMYIDTLSLKIKECSIVIPVKNDTIYFSFTPSKSGSTKIENVITAISKDKKGIYRYHKIDFDYQALK